MSGISTFLLSNVVYELFDSGVANILGLETLTHGTNPVNYLRIRAYGGDPSHGGKATGSTAGWENDKEVVNHFYVFKDSELEITNPRARDMPIQRGALNRILPSVHTFLSGYNFVARAFSDNAKKYIAVKYFSIFLSSVGGICSGLVTPRVRFRFSKIDPERFENDPMYVGTAYRTKQLIEAWRIGLLGSLLTGVNTDWFSRAKKHPNKVLTGVVQLTCAAAITTLSMSMFVSNPAIAVAGVLLA